MNEGHEEMKKEKENRKNKELKCGGRQGGWLCGGHGQPTPTRSSGGKGPPLETTRDHHSVVALRCTPPKALGGRPLHCRLMDTSCGEGIGRSPVASEVTL